MLVHEEKGGSMASRVRPARLTRWRRYVPALGLLLVSLLPLLATTRIGQPLLALGLSLHTTRVILAACGIALLMAAATLANQHPVPVLALGTAAAILSASMLQGPLLGTPFLLAGSGWLAYLEGRRLFEGITLSPRGITLHRFLKSPLIIEHGDIHHVHTAMHDDHRGTLILETKHGTVTAPHLPSCTTLQARIEARLSPATTDATQTSLTRARERVEGLLGR